MLIGSIRLCANTLTLWMLLVTLTGWFSDVKGATPSPDVLIIRHGRSRVRHSTELRWGLKALDNLTIAFDDDVTNSSASSTESGPINGTDFDSSFGVNSSSLLTDDLEQLDRMEAQLMTESTIRANVPSLPVTSKKKVRKKEIMENIRKDVDKGLEYLRTHINTIDASTVSLIDVKIKRNGANSNRDATDGGGSDITGSNSNSNANKNNNNNNVSIGNKRPDDILRQLISQQQAKLMKQKKMMIANAGGTGGTIDSGASTTIVDSNKSITSISKNNRALLQLAATASKSQALSLKRHNHHPQQSSGKNDFNAQTIVAITATTTKTNNDYVDDVGKMPNDDVDSNYDSKRPTAKFQPQLRSGNGGHIIIGGSDTSQDNNNLNKHKHSVMESADSSSNNEYTVDIDTDSATASIVTNNNKNSNYPMEFNSGETADEYNNDDGAIGGGGGNSGSNIVGTSTSDDINELLNDVDEDVTDVDGDRELSLAGSGGGLNSVYQVEEINFDDLDLDEVSRSNRKNLMKGQDVVTTFLRIVESQHLLGSNCTAGTALNLGEGVVDRYAQDRFRVEAEIAVNRANMLTR